MSKPNKPTLLTLPREIRQKIILEAYNVDASEELLKNFIEMIRARGVRNILGYPSLMLPRTREMLFADAQTTILKEVHREMVADVEYVTGKLDWIAELRKIPR